MISGKEYLEIVKQYFSFLSLELGFEPLKETINGNAFYDVEYKNSDKIISISYENIEDYLSVIVFELKNGIVPDYNDKARTFHLQELSSEIISKLNQLEIRENSMIFKKFIASGGFEKRLLKSAKDLRMVLIHWSKL
jgi:hypothetical protein